jgi:sigma-B regulation protein RsbU (phosphoserine phosphatase)
MLYNHLAADGLFAPSEHPSPEMELARQVQQHLFPRQLPHAPRWEFAGVCRPARRVAGDYYDLFDIGSGRVAVAVGDVSGKGLGPALVASALHALIRSRLPMCADNLSSLADAANRYLLASTPDDLFVTLFVGVLDVTTGRLRYVNAGHPAPLLLPDGEPQVVELDRGGPPLGILPDAVHEEGHVMLPPGALLAVFSDGLTEARRENGEPFQTWRVATAMRDSRPLSARAALTRVLEEVAEFAGEADRDDVTLVVVSRA